MSAEQTDGHTGGPTPPVAAQRDHRREHHGDLVIDPYEWLRDDQDPAVRAHLEAENAYAEEVTAGLQPLREELFSEIKARTRETDLTTPTPSGPWWYFSRTVEGRQYRITCRAPRQAGDPVPDVEATPELPGEVVLLDENALAEGHDFFSLGALEISPDHARLAYAVDVAGDERFDVTIIDLASGETLDDSVRGIGYGAVFSADGRQLYYVRVDDAWRPFEVWRHQVGGDPAGDVLIHREEDESFWLGIDRSRGDHFIVLGLGSRTTSEVHLIDAHDPAAPMRCVAPRESGIEYDVEVAADHLLIVHNARDRERDLAWAPLDATARSQWRPLLEAGEGERLMAADAYDDFTLLSLRRGGVPAVRILPRDTRGGGAFEAAHYAAPRDLVIGEDPLASLGALGAADPDTDRIRVSHESWVSPRALYDVVIATGEQILLRRQPVEGVDLSRYSQRREWVTASDGTSIPVSLISLAGTGPDGTNPGLLYGYGSYEISLDPYFSIARLSLLDRGVVYAVAHVRGGGEMGRGWYEAGRLDVKRATFTDFVDVATWLHQSGWVALDRLAAEGGSAGGLLVGAAVNLAPERFRAVLAAVPFVDALTTILRPDLPLTVGEWDEWGNPLADPAVYAYMRSYSPYENVAEVEYPAILATTSLNDTRVSYTEPAKWIARLRERATNGPERPLLLKTEMEAGHGGRSGRYDSWRETAWEWSFLLDQIGAASRVEESP